MLQKNDGPVVGSAAGPGRDQSSMRPHCIRPRTKISRVLAALLAEWIGNRFDAERELHDHCIHSSVASLQRKGVMIDRRDEVVAGYQGAPTRVMRYWLNRDTANLARAEALLAGHHHAGG